MSFEVPTVAPDASTPRTASLTMLRESRIPVSKPVRATPPIGDSVDASAPLSATQRTTRVSPFQLTKASV